VEDDEAHDHHHHHEGADRDDPSDVQPQVGRAVERYRRALVERDQVGRLLALAFGPAGDPIAAGQE
jgi:fatty acid desaturase